MTAVTVKLPPAALVVSKPMAEPARSPLLVTVVRLPSNVVVSAVVNSPVPPTLKATVPPLFTVRFAGVQLEVTLL